MHAESGLGNAGERLYIHCWGGHGRTGTLVATMLARLYSLSCSSALRYTQVKVKVTSGHFVNACCLHHCLLCSTT